MQVLLRPSAHASTPHSRGFHDSRCSVVTTHRSRGTCRSTGHRQFVELTPSLPAPPPTPTRAPDAHGNGTRFRCGIGRGRHVDHGSPHSEQSFSERHCSTARTSARSRYDCVDTLLRSIRSSSETPLPAARATSPEAISEASGVLPGCHVRPICAHIVKLLSTHSVTHPDATTLISNVSLTSLTSCPNSRRKLLCGGRGDVKSAPSSAQPAGTSCSAAGGGLTRTAAPHHQPATQGQKLTLRQQRLHRAGAGAEACALGACELRAFFAGAARAPPSTN